MESHNVKLELRRPFGPIIGKFVMPKQIIDELNEACDKLAKSKSAMKKADHSKTLAGVVKHELQIPPKVMYKQRDFWNQIFLQYMHKAGEVSCHPRYILANEGVGIQTGWFNRAFAGDYNPTHTHPSAVLSLAGFLKIPNWKKEIARTKKKAHPGRLQFMYGNTEEFSTNSQVVIPIVGECYVFPAMLTHLVYPFRSPGERRSFSINFGRKLLDPQEKK